MKRMTGNGIATGLAYYERLRDIEDILGDEYDLDELKEAVRGSGQTGGCEGTRAETALRREQE